MTPPVPALAVTSATAIPLAQVRDHRGLLSFGEFGTHLPFVPLRYFVISGVTQGATRGDHAHRTLHQFIVCLHGACTLTVDDGSRRDSLILDSGAIGVHARPMTWCLLGEFTPDAVVMVLASAAYDPADYIHDYGEFQQLAGAPE